MKRFFNFNFFTVVMWIIFLAGLVVTAVLENWLAFVWAAIGVFWMGMSRGHEAQQEVLREEYEDKLTELRGTRDEYIKLYKEASDKYEAKLKENYNLASHNKALSEDNLRLAKENQALGGQGQALGAATVVEKRGTRGNIKLKRKKQAVQETDAYDTYAPDKP